MALKSYRELDAWKEAMDLVEGVYEITRAFPDDERFALTSQIRKAVTSVPSNIAEGYGRSHRKEYIHHLFMARGSLMEVETQLIIAVRLDYVTREQAKPLWEQLDKTGRILGGLIKSLQD